MFGPLFINDIKNVVSCNSLLFADDLKVYCRIDVKEDCLLLQKYIGSVTDAK